MTYDPKKHHRRSIRLDDYDYARAGAYFVTICTAGRRCLFGQIQNDTMELNEHGRIVHEAWCDLPNHYPHVELDAFIVMPNHVHMIVLLADPGAGPVQADSVQADSVPADSVRVDSVRAGLKPAPTTTNTAAPDTTADTTGADSVRAGLKPAPTTARRHGLPEIIRAFKTFSARRINEHSAIRGGSLWHRNYYEHIIRNDVALNRIRQYIAENPMRWPWDPDNLQAVHPASDDPWRE